MKPAAILSAGLFLTTANAFAIDRRALGRRAGVQTVFKELMQLFPQIAKIIDGEDEPAPYEDRSEYCKLRIETDSEKLNCKAWAKTGGKDAKWEKYEDWNVCYWDEATGTSPPQFHKFGSVGEVRMMFKKKEKEVFLKEPEVIFLRDDQEILMQMWENASEGFKEGEAEHTICNIEEHMYNNPFESKKVTYVYKCAVPCANQKIDSKENSIAFDASSKCYKAAPVALDRLDAATSSLCSGFEVYSVDPMQSIQREIDGLTDIHGNPAKLSITFKNDKPEVWNFDAAACKQYAKDLFTNDKLCKGKNADSAGGELTTTHGLFIADTNTIEETRECYKEGPIALDTLQSKVDEVCKSIGRYVIPQGEKFEKEVGGMKDIHGKGSKLVIRYENNKDFGGWLVTEAMCKEDAWKLLSSDQYCHGKNPDSAGGKLKKSVGDMIVDANWE